MARAHSAAGVWGNVSGRTRGKRRTAGVKQSGIGVNLKEVYMDIIIEEILSAIFDGLLHGKKVPKAVKYVAATLVYGFVIAIFALCAISASKTNILFMVFCIILTVIFTVFYVKILMKIHRNEFKDDDL